MPVGTRGAAGAGSGPRRADRPALEADAIASAQARAYPQAQAQAEAGRPRRRVGWRKGSEVDEEMWPTEAFGGVSDEQFWDDLASDKPLATTARTAAIAATAATAATAAPPASGARRRLPDVVPSRDGDDRGRGDGNRLGPQPQQSGPHPIPGGTQPISAATRSYQPGTQPQPYQAAAQSYQPTTQPSYQPPTQPAPVVGQGGRAGLPADPRGRGRMANGSDVGPGAAAAEDPLTSSAYSLRPPGAVDGRSYPSSRRSREQYEAPLSQETQSFSLAEAQSATGGYPGGAHSFRQFETPAGSGGKGRGPEPRPDGVRSEANRYEGLRSDPLRGDPLRTDPLRSDAYQSGGRADPLRGAAGTADAYSSTAGHPYPERPYGDPHQSATTPSYGETYGYGYPVSPADDPRQPNGTRGTRGHGRSGGNGSLGARHAYPTGNGYRAPYDPRTNGRG